MTGTSAEPACALAVIVVSPGPYDAVRETMARLRAQTARAKLELVLVAPSLAELDLDESELEGFGAVRLVETGPDVSPARARAVALAELDAPVVVLAEEHSFPEPGWAEALIEAHRGPWAAVGAVMLNGNPHTRTSWADFLVSFGRWSLGAAGEMDELPGHNTSYKRPVLAGLGDGLERALQVETVLHWELRAHGERLWLEPRARTAHLNASAPGLWVALRFDKGRQLAAARSAGWPRRRRALYVLGFPLIPAVRLWRLGRALPPGAVPKAGRAGIRALVVLGLAVESAGEAFGYVAGADRSDRLERYELSRSSFFSRRDREAAGDRR